jgi:hypothetical protein
LTGTDSDDIGRLGHNWVKKETVPSDVAAQLAQLEPPIDRSELVVP